MRSLDVSVDGVKVGLLNFKVIHMLKIIWIGRPVLNTTLSGNVR